MERLGVSVNAYTRALVVSTSLLVTASSVGCGSGSQRGSLASEGGSTEQRSSGDESASGDGLTFPDEAQANAAPPATEEVLAAEALLADGRVGEAEQRLTAIVRETPGDVRALLDLGLAHEMQDEVREAEEAYRAALRVDPAFSEALNNLGALLRDTDRTEEALRVLREAVRVRPGFASAQLNLGLTLEDAGDDEGAERAYRMVMRLAPREPTSRTNLGLLLLRANRRDQALIELRRAVPLAQSRAELGALGAGLRRAGDPAMAVRVLQQAMDVEERIAPPGLRAEHALAEFASGQREQAEGHLRGLVAVYAPAHYLLGNLLAAREAWAEAASAYEAYLRAEPRGEHAAEARGRLDYVRTRAR